MNEPRPIDQPRAIPAYLRVLPAAADPIPGYDDDLHALSALLRPQLIAYAEACARKLALVPRGTHEETSVLEQLNREIEIVRSALTCLFDDGCDAQAMALTSSLTRFWQRYDRHREALSLFARASSAETAIPPASLAAMNEASALLQKDLGEYALARRAITEALALYQQLGDETACERTRFLQAACAADLGQWRDSRLAAPHPQQLRPGADHAARQARALHTQGWIDLQEGQLHLAEERFEAACALWFELGDREQIARVCISLGSLAIRTDDIALALSWFERAASIARSNGNRAMLAEVLADLAAAHTVAGRCDEAVDLLEQTFALYAELGNRARLPEAMEAGGVAALSKRRYAIAVRFYQAAAQLREESGFMPFAPWGLRTNGWIEQLEEATGRSFHSPGPASDAPVCPDELIAQAAVWIAELKINSPGTSVASGLTDRERDVLHLLALGMTDRAMADALFITRKTASKHVSALLRKLGAPTRTAAVAIAVRDGLIELGP